MQSSDSTKQATILNKIGGRFNVKVPEGGLVFQNITIDSIDSVIDSSNSTEGSKCVNELTDSNCCKVIINNDVKVVQCTYTNASGSYDVKPFYNM